MHARNLPVAAARLVTAFAVAIALSVGFATAAFAVTTDYPPDPVSRTFSTSAGSWTGTSRHRRPALHPADHLSRLRRRLRGVGRHRRGRRRLPAVDLRRRGRVLATARTEWTSPAFSYTGAGGSTPDEVFFTMDRRVNAAALLAVISGARYRVFLDDQAPSTEPPGDPRPAGPEPAHVGLGTRRRRGPGRPDGRSPVPDHHPDDVSAWSACSRPALRLRQRAAAGQQGRRRPRGHGQ